MVVNSLQLKVDEKNHAKNLKNNLNFLCSAPEGSITSSSELALTGFSYENFEEAAFFSKKSLETLKENSSNKTFIFSMIEKRNNNFFNSAKIIHNKQIIHSQDKYKLFPLGEELKYFTKGDIEKIKLAKIGNLKVGILICFELRFTQLWERLKGADIIFIPALWGTPRKEHLEVLAKSLAILNQCFVIVSNSSSYAKSSSIIDPFGNMYKDDRKSILTKDINLKQIEKMKKYIKMD